MPKTQDYLIKGSYNYFLDFQIKGQTPFQSCILSVNAFSKSDRKIALAIKCIWARNRGSRSYILLGLNSNTYQLSAQDLGAIIELEVVPQEEGFKGSAFISFGPVELESGIKATLEGILAAGGSKFPINLVQEDNGRVLKENAALLLTNDCVRIVLNLNEKEERTLKFRYSLEEPEIEMNNLDTNLIALTFKGIFPDDMAGLMRFLQESRLNLGLSCRLSLRTLTKTARDLIYLAIKCFAAKSFLLDSTLISGMEALFNEGKIFSSKMGKALGTLGGLLLEVEGLKKEVTYLLKFNVELSGEKETLLVEIRSLEKELSETIEAYSQAIMEIKSSGTMHNESMILEASMLGRKDELFYKNELRKANEDKKKLIEKISVMTEELELNRNFNKNAGYFAESHIWTKKEALIMDNSRILSSPNSDYQTPDTGELKELKARNAGLEAKLSEYKQLIERNNSTSNLKSLENKFQETKKLNEMLLNELNDRKAGRDSNNDDKNTKILEQKLASLTVKTNQEISFAEGERNRVQRDYEALKLRFAKMEAELQEAKKKTIFLEKLQNSSNTNSELYARFDQERNSLNNDLFSIRAKANKLGILIN